MSKVYIATVDNPTTATTGQVLTKTSTGSEWADALDSDTVQSMIDEAIGTVLDTDFGGEG